MHQYIDHTLLKPDATRYEIDALCGEAIRYRFASVCVNPIWIGHVATRLEGSGVAPCCVIGFPLGATLPDVKAYEAKSAIALGAAELDMVINIGAAKEGRWADVEEDIRAVTEAASGKALVKVIIEACLLTDDEKSQACLAAKRAGADFVKTSTGFSSGGAVCADVRLMREAVGPQMGVKASGGIRTREDAENMLSAGANRLGASAGIKIVEG